MISPSPVALRLKPAISPNTQSDATRFYTDTSGSRLGMHLDGDRRPVHAKNATHIGGDGAVLFSHRKNIFEEFHSRRSNGGWGVFVPPPKHKTAPHPNSFTRVQSHKTIETLKKTQQ